MHRRARIMTGCVLLLLCRLSMAQTLPASPPPPGAGYVTKDGAIRIVGTDSFRWTLERIDALFTQSHPNFHFSLDLKAGYVAMPQLVEGTTAFSPMAREVTLLELEAYRQRVGGAPIMVKVAHGTVTSQTRTGALAVYVNAKNPLARLTTVQIAQIFSEGNPAGDFTQWGQLGLPSEWKARAIHVVGTPEDAGFGSWQVDHLQQGRGFRRGYTQLLSSVEILKVVADDPAAIGLCAIDFLGPGLKMLEIGNPDGTWSSGSADDISAGRYGLDRFVYLFLRLRPDGSLDPWIKDYVRLMLSEDGQQIVAAEKDGFLPLNRAEAAAELEKLR